MITHYPIGFEGLVSCGFQANIKQVASWPTAPLLLLPKEETQILFGGEMGVMKGKGRHLNFKGPYYCC